MSAAVYQSRLATEKRIYEACLDVHRLPPIFHYWSDTFVRPRLEQFGFSSSSQFFLQSLTDACRGRPAQLLRVVSLGSGNCDLEISLALDLQPGYSNFRIDCLDVNPAMLERGRDAAQRQNVESHIEPVLADFNYWEPGAEYDIVIANQSLHHVCRLERLFEEIRRCLRPGGLFLVSDMIGRNGHQRWPEALAIVHEFWRRLPPSYRYNRKLERYEELYENWDCSKEGFEGIRSQDILPLLVETFHFHLFVPFGNVIDPFVDRAFGPNFDGDAKWDRFFIEQVHRRDDAEILAGNIAPTHMIAALANKPCRYPRFHDHLSPAFCIREPNLAAPVPANPEPPYLWSSWPHPPQREFEIACQRLAAQSSRCAELEREVAHRTDWAQTRDREWAERTEWALRLEREVKEGADLALQLRHKLDAQETLAADAADRASELERHLEARAAQAAELEAEIKVRTNWALDLQAKLDFSERRAIRLELEIRSYLRNPFRLAIRFLQAIRNRITRWNTAKSIL